MKNLRVVVLLGVLNSVLGLSQAQALDIPDGLNDDQTVQFLIPYFNSKTGRTLQGAEVVFWDGRSNLDADMQRARDRANTAGSYAFTLPVIRNTAGNWASTDAPPGGMHTCFIAILTTGDFLHGRARNTVLAHELYHCYQFQKLGSAAMRAAPDWLIEGGANYVGESTVGGTDVMGSWWESYLGEVSPYNSRSYDGFGLFFHMEAHGTDPWQIMEQALTDSTGDHAQSFVRMMDSVDLDVAETWPMSLARRPDWGSDWEAQGKDIPPHSSYPAQQETLTTPNLQVEVPFSQPKHLVVHLATDQPIRVRLQNMVGGIRIFGDSGALYEEKLGPGAVRDFCQGQNCGCPNGDDAINMISVRGARMIVLAVYGFSPGGSNRVIIEPASGQCCPGSANLEPGMVGNWTMEMDPLKEGVVPPRYPNETRDISGSATIKVNRNGAFIKQTHVRVNRAWLLDDGGHSYTYNVQGTVTGCMETRPYPGYPGRFFFKLTHLNDT